MSNQSAAVHSRKRTDVREWARQQSAEAESRAADAERKRQETRKRNGVRRALPAPKDLKPRVFHVPVRLRRKWFHDAEHFWCAAYFLHMIHFRRRTWRADEDGWTRLLYRLLEQIIPRPILKAIKATLLARQVIKCDFVAIKGTRAYGYQVAPDFNSRREARCGDAKLNARIWRAHARAEERLLPVHHWLKDFYQRLRFDSERARRIIATFKKPRGYPGSTAEYRADRQDYWDALVSGEWWFIRCAYGRFHHPLTALEEELRCCLSVDGVPLVNVDVKNCQPLLLGVKAMQWLTMSKMSRSRERNRKFDDDTDPYHATNQTLTHRNKINPHPTRTRITNVNTSENAVNLRGYREGGSVTLPGDLLRYIACCERGEFYESMMTEEQKRQGKAGRDRLKNLFMAVLFGENNAKGRFPNETRKRFGRLWPTAAGVLAKLKKRSYKHSSHVLQNLEATMMIYRVCGRIMRERPNLSIYSVHDSLMVPPVADNVDYVRRLIVEEFATLGVKPKLKVEAPDNNAKGR